MCWYSSPSLKLIRNWVEFLNLDPHLSESHSLICSKGNPPKCQITRKWHTGTYTVKATALQISFPQAWHTHCGSTPVVPPCVSLSCRVFTFACRLLFLPSCKSLPEQSGCFVNPWRLNNRQLSRLIRLLGLYCHQGWADKWSEQACCHLSNATLKGIITDALISILHTGLTET